MEDYEHELNLELSHYNETLRTIKSQLEYTKKDSLKSVTALRETNRDMWENSSHSADDFDDAVQLSQFYQPLAGKTFAVEFNAKKIHQLEILEQSAYFARIDFCSGDKEQYDKIYIGKGTLLDDIENNVIIYDWRSPVASLFYRFGTGNAYYDAPGGRITGDMGLKRQYEIKNGVFEYFFDADVRIEDEFLRKILSGNTSVKMKTIVETIQKDQDIAIRNVTHDLLMVQGIAGSGKTSVALHRVAYLKYQGISNQLKSSDIIILSPNTLFVQYISNVLPELGEEEVKSIIFDDFITNILPDMTAFQSRCSQTEMLISCDIQNVKAIKKQSMEFKMSEAFIKILSRYADSLSTSHIFFPDIVYDEKTVFTGQHLKNRFAQMDNKISLAVRLRHLRHHIFDKIHEMRKGRMPRLLLQARNDPNHPFDWEEYARQLSIEESTRLSEKIDEFVKLDSIKLYKKLINTDGLLLSLSEEIELPDNIDEILSYSREKLTSPMLQNEDALAAVCLHLLIGADNVAKDIYRHIRQVVVDEAQDYYSLHFEILKRLFPNARYTILGDVNQTIEKQENMNLYNRIVEIIQPANPYLMFMNKSFRCTREILSFNMQFLDDYTTFESFNRSGDTPQVVKTDNIEQLDEKIIMEAVYSKNQGYQSIGIICKYVQEAEALYRRLKDRLDIHLVRPGESLDTTGTFIITITLSKGLEFDSVLIYGTDNNHYHSVDDKKLLYIAGTRALHRLNLFHTGEKSSLIQGGIQI